VAEPPYVALHRSGELERRATRALELLGSPCRVCPRLCSVDRLADERGLCRIGRRAMVDLALPPLRRGELPAGNAGVGSPCRQFAETWEEFIQDPTEFRVEGDTVALGCGRACGV
jgi:hypothetical protein